MRASCARVRARFEIKLRRSGLTHWKRGLSFRKRVEVHTVFYMSEFATRLFKVES